MRRLRFVVRAKVRARVRARVLTTALAIVLAAAACQRSLPNPAQDPSAPAQGIEIDLERPHDPNVTVRRQTHMSTFVTVTLAEPDSAAVQAAIDAAFARIAELEGILSEWRPGSEVAAVIAQAGGAPVAVSAPVLTVFRKAQEVSAASSGAFDITVGSLWGLWDFKWEDPRVPSDAELANKLPLVDWRKIEIDPVAGTVRLASQGMKVALGGIAKGFIVDEASAVLKQRGFANHLIVAGGDGYAAGRKHGNKWRVGVRHPRREVFGILEVENEGFATSGDYERYFIRDGVRYHHILDPRTGKPARGVVACTLVAKNAMTADANGKAVFVSGVDAGLAHARRAGVHALIFDEATLSPHMTAEMEARLDVLAIATPSGPEPHEAHLPAEVEIPR